MLNLIKNLRNILIQKSNAFKSSAATESINCDRSFEIIVKRLLLEFKNEDRILISPSLKFLIQKFYFLNHINIEVKVNLLLEQDATRFDICVVNTHKINKNGNFEPKQEDHSMNKVINNIEKKTKIISVMKFANISNQLNLSLLNYKPTFDMLITDKCVFQLNKHERNLELIEGDLNELELDFNNWDFKPLISRNILKNLKQECI